MKNWTSSGLVLLAVSFLLFTAQKCNEDYKYPEETMVKISKTACFGECPVYSFTLQGDGQATFNGKRFTELEGPHRRTYSADTTNTVFKEMIGMDLYQYESEYTDQITDLPTTYLTFQHEGREKEIKLYYGFPKELEDLANRLQELAFAEGWEAVPVEK